MGSLLSVDPLEFAQKVTGICTDHAANQKKLTRVVQEWKRDAGCELHGKHEILTQGEVEIVGAVAKAWDEVLLEIGGMGSWELLSKEGQDESIEHIICQVWMIYGEEAYEKLTPTEKHCADCYECAPSGLENSKTLKHKTKPTFKTYPFHLMLIIYMSFIP